MQKLSQTREKKIEMLRFLRSPENSRFARSTSRATREYSIQRHFRMHKIPISKQSRPLNELSRAQKFFERRYSPRHFRISEANVSSGDGDTNRAISARVRCEKTSKRATRRQCVPLLFVDVEETEVPTKDAVRMVKPNMVELKCFLFLL